MTQSERHPGLATFDALVGDWTTEMTHPAFPGVVVSGGARYEWLEGEHFLIGRSRTDHPQFPDALTVIGAAEDGLSMHYYDSRGVERVYGTRLRDGVLEFWRDEPGFAQRFSGRVSDGGATIPGLWQLSSDGSTWEDDLKITFRRAAGG